MPHPRTLRPALLAALFALVAAAGASAQQATVVYLVRHAEKAGESGDVPLNEAGQERALLLARMLADVPLSAVHSTDYIRTRDTAAPIAADHDLAVELYDPLTPTGFVVNLARAGGHHLVVGHSNTVPDLVRALGGDPVAPIDDAEYDRLYVVVIPPGERSGVTSSLIRFGEAFQR